ncbi:unnamed protein product [Darwinula stevensoni]|uniref:Nudix hydrolase domain-containing protein n=1 Tax=Darwinula stevensoni TaxID=69355 RepID=A0A7R8ZXX2_9CRUS|nr:unnamed protein product [Darwinula stevensoni]CAG0880297.1 unnamed protein product [Darwinula stevensoni]
MNEENPWVTLTCHEVYDNNWINVTHRDVLNPAGGKGIYGMVHFKNAAIGIIPLDDDNNTWIVGQYRYTLEEYSWEIVEGGGTLGVSLLDSAMRELLEETGIVASDWQQIAELHTSNSVTDEFGVVYIARGLTFTDADPEETELLQVRKLPFWELHKMAMRGEITDAMSLVGILKVAEMLRNGTAI